MGTTAFMLAVLGSNIFWIGYGIVTIVVAGALMRKNAPNSYKYVTTGRCPGRYDDGFDKMSYLWITFLNLAFWPLIVSAIGIYYFAILLCSLFRVGIGWAFRGAEKLTPNVDIKIRRIKT